MKKKTAAEKTLTEIAKIALFEANAKTGIKKIQKILENLQKTRWLFNQIPLFLKHESTTKENQTRNRWLQTGSVL